MWPSKENLRYVATIAEIAAAIGVMISVIYLALQIESGNKELRAQTYSSALERVHRPSEMVIESQELSDIVRVGTQSPENLNEAEWPRFLRWQAIRFDSYEYTYYARRDGAITEELWQGMDHSFTSNIGSEPGTRKAWSQLRHQFAEPFQSFIDSKVDAAESGN